MSTTNQTPAKETTMTTTTNDSSYARYLDRTGITEANRRSTAQTPAANPTPIDLAMQAAREYRRAGSLNPAALDQLEASIVHHVGTWADGVLTIPQTVATAMGRRTNVIRRA